MDYIQVSQPEIPRTVVYACPKHVAFAGRASNFLLLKVSFSQHLLGNIIQGAMDQQSTIKARRCDSFFKLPVHFFDLFGKHPAKTLEVFNIISN